MLIIPCAERSVLKIPVLKIHQPAASIAKAARKAPLAKKARKIPVQLRLSIYYYYKVFNKPYQHICRLRLQFAERDISQLQFQYEPLEFNISTLLFNFIDLVRAESILKKYEKHERRLQHSTSSQKKSQ